MGEEEEQIGRMLHFFKTFQILWTVSTLLSSPSSSSSRPSTRHASACTSARSVMSTETVRFTFSCHSCSHDMDILITENDCIVSAWLKYKR